MSGYDHAITATGARIVNVGIPNVTPRAGKFHVTPVDAFEGAITERTVAIAYAPHPGSSPPLEEVIAVGRKYRIPVILDAASLLPPVKNLRKFIAMGADLVCYSGGKGLRGPQASGILCGRRDLVAAAALQNLDMARTVFNTWDPPRSLIPKESLRSVPNHGIGRGMKVSKETIAGLLTALQLFTEEECRRDFEQCRLLLERISQHLQGIHGVQTTQGEHILGGYPVLHVWLEKDKLGQDAFQVSQRLKEGSPSIYVREQLHDGLLSIHSLNLNKERTDAVRKRLHMILVDQKT